jgi:hypothetical protein
MSDKLEEKLEKSVMSNNGKPEVKMEKWRKTILRNSSLLLCGTGFNHNPGWVSVANGFSIHAKEWGGGTFRIPIHQVAFVTYVPRPEDSFKTITPQRQSISI